MATSPSWPPATSTTSTRARRTTRSASWSATRSTARCTPSSPTTPTTPVPDLADGEPEISSDNKTITVKIKKGVKYAPPVDREVTSKDVKYAIERAFTTNVPSGYATSYFAEIEGAPEDAPIKIAELKPFTGLQTPDDNTLVIKLTKPVAQRVAAALVMPITMPVPEEYAAKFDKKDPTDYDQYVAFTGPYMVKNDADRQGHRPSTRASASRSSATRTGTRPPTTGRRSWTRSPSRRATTT